MKSVLRNRFSIYFPKHCILSNRLVDNGIILLFGRVDRSVHSELFSGKSWPEKYGEVLLLKNWDRGCILMLLLKHGKINIINNKE
jgi:hypothetical protein